MKIAVTGCTGSVGKRVVLLALKLGHSVVGIDNTNSSENMTSSKFSFFHLDLTVFEDTIMALRDCEAVVHLAALRSPDDYAVKTHNANVVISWNVLRAAAELGICRVAQASSVNVLPLIYSKEQRYEYFPIDEEHPCLPDEPYGLSKVICEAQASTLVRRYPNMRISSLRLHWSVPERAKAAARTEENASRDLFGWVQEDAAAEAFLLALDPDNKRWGGHEVSRRR